MNWHDDMAADGWLRVCAVEGCGNARQGAASMCGVHIYRKHRYGSVHATSKVTARNGEPLELIARRLAEPGNDECWEWPHARRNGYAVVWSDGAVHYVHRIITSAPDGLQVRHLCGSGAAGCWNPRHLALGTAAENAVDKFGHGTQNRKLSDRDVEAIRERVRLGESALSVARDFPWVHPRTVNNAARGRTFKHLEMAP